MSTKRKNTDNLESEYVLRLKEIAELYNDRLVTGLEFGNKTSLKHIGYMIKELNQFIKDLKSEVKAVRHTEPEYS